MGQEEYSNFTEECEREAAKANKEVAIVLEAMEELDKYVQYAIIGRTLERLLFDCRTLIIHWDDDRDVYTVTATRIIGVEPEEQHSRTFERESLMDTIRAMYSEKPRKKCRKCGEMKFLSEFSKYKSRAHKDGRNNYCKTCERERIKEWSDANRGKAEPKPFEGKRKRCKRCQQSRHLHLFSRDASRADGKNIYCHRCIKEMRTKERTSPEKCGEGENEKR